MKTLEIEYNKLSHGFILRPSPNAFEVLDDELGDGNFSKIYKVANKTPDKTIFAMKVLLYYCSNIIINMYFMNTVCY